MSEFSKLFMESQILTEVTLRLRYIQIEEFITSEYFRARKTYKTIFFLQYSLSPQINSTIIRTSKPQKHYQKCTDIMARISAFFFLCDGSHIWYVSPKSQVWPFTYIPGAPDVCHTENSSVSRVSTGLPGQKLSILSYKTFL